MTNRIADLRLEQFEVNQQRDALFQSDAFVAKLEEGHSSEVNDEVHAALLEVIDMRRELLDQFNKQLGNQLMMAINLQINQQQLMSVSSSLKEILTQQIFWVNSNKPMDWEWIKAFPEALKGQFKAMKITVNWEKAWPAVFIAFLAGLPLLLIAGLIRWRLQWLKDYQAKLASQVGQLRNDTQLHTPKAILIDLIRALPVVLVILAIGLILLTMQLNISGLLWAYSKKAGHVLAGLWSVLESAGKERRGGQPLQYACAVDQPLAATNCSRQPRVAAAEFLVGDFRAVATEPDGRRAGAVCDFLQSAADCRAGLADVSGKLA